MMIDLNKYTGYLQNRNMRVLLIALIPVTLFTLYFSYETSFFTTNYGSLETNSDPKYRHGLPHPAGQPPNMTNAFSGPDTAMTDLVRALWQPILHPVDAPHFESIDGEKYKLPGAPRFTKPLGKKICILDIDNRPLDDVGQILNKEPQPWDKFRPLSSGMLGHYLYALIHGYDYKYIRAPSYSHRDPRYGTWVKVVMMKEALKDHDFIVFMDADASFTNFQLPVEWLINYWKIGKNTLVAMAKDPDEGQNFDAKGQIYLNTGFVIAQQSERTQQMYKDWAECPSEKKYKGCGEWRERPFHEQAAFGSYIRYDYNRKDDVRVLSCAEANGCPEAAHRGTIGGCKGIFVRHYWHDKTLTLRHFSTAVMSAITPRLHSQFNTLRPEFMIDAHEMVLEGSNVFDNLFSLPEKSDDIVDKEHQHDIKQKGTPGRPGA